MKAKYIEIVKNQHQTMLSFKGSWTLPYIEKIAKELQRLKLNGDVVVDLSGVSDFDSSGVLLLIDWQERISSSVTLDIIGYTPKQLEMYELLSKTHYTHIPKPKTNLLSDIGKGFVEVIREHAINFPAARGQETYWDKNGSHQIVSGTIGNAEELSAILDTVAREIGLANFDSNISQDKLELIEAKAVIKAEIAAEDNDLLLKEAEASNEQEFEVA